MGLNVDLTQMLGVPEKLPCPKCGNPTPTYFDDFDIECGNPNPNPGHWRLRVGCQTCDHDFYHEFTILRSTA